MREMVLGLALVVVSLLAMTALVLVSFRTIAAIHRRETAGEPDPQPQPRGRTRHGRSG